MLGFSTIGELMIGALPQIVEIEPLVYVRAPSGPGYTAQRVELQVRQPNTQENYR